MMVKVIAALIATFFIGSLGDFGLRAENRLLFAPAILPSGDSVASINLVLQNEVDVSGLLLGLQFDQRLRLDSIQAVGRSTSISTSEFRATRKGQAIYLSFDEAGNDFAPDSGAVARFWFTMNTLPYVYQYQVGFGETQMATSGPELLVHEALGSFITFAYVRGDVDGNGFLTISDAVFLINYIFAGGPAPNPLIQGDVDCSGLVNISDAVYMINFIFAGGPVPCLK